MKTLEEQIYQVISKAIEEEIEKEITKVQVAVEKRVRARVGGIAATVVKNLSYEYRGEELLIRVKFTESPKT